MQYYLEISSWNLIESFVTESISPYSFYGERSFGNNLSRYLSGEKEKTNYLILSTQDLGGEISLVVDESLIDSSCLGHIRRFTKNPVYTYPKTIYYKKGLVKFRFNSTVLRESVISESKILLEVKCLDKYCPDFYVKTKKTENRPTISNLKEDSFLLERHSYLIHDNTYNKIKGAIIGYTRGIFTTSDSTKLDLLYNLRDLKNTFGGINTQIMMSDRLSDGSELLYQIEKCKKLYETNIGKTYYFDVLLSQFNEIVSLAMMRSEELVDNSWTEKEELINEKTKIENSLSEIERSYNILIVKKELNNIKATEKENGKKRGKTRLYFKKGTPEYERKKELNRIVSEFEKGNAEYQLLKRKLYLIEQKLSTDVNKYDAVLSALFTRVSDIMNDLIKEASGITSKTSVDLSQLEMNKGVLYLHDKEYDPEVSYFNILLGCILKNTNSLNLSEYAVLQLLEESARTFKDAPISSSGNGIVILNTLREYWLYKNQKSDRFTIPDGMPIFQSIMSFFVKPLGFDQIERYMMIKKYSQKAYAFMLWGAWIGFADMPKTFTNVLYQNDEIDSIIDNKLYTMIDQV